jgi:hypothetical protein
MADPIEVHYTPDGDDWTVTVKGRGQTLTGEAPGLIAARDRADQLVEKMTPGEPGHKTVVHLLNGDAVEFTTAYLTARLAKPEPEKPAEVPAPTATTEKAETGKAESREPEKTPKPTPAPSPRAGSDADKSTEKTPEQAAGTPAEPQEAPATS